MSLRMTGQMDRNKLLYILCGAAFLVVMFNLLTQGRAPARERVVSLSELTEYAKGTLAEIQGKSIRNNQEYCGVIFEDENGNLQTSQIYPGERAECFFDWGVPLGFHVVASFHSHGGVDEGYASEIPSSLDLATDIDARIDGFVGTPGGRVWHNSWQEGVTSQVCGEGCLEQDSRYGPSESSLPGLGRVATRYSMDELNSIFGTTGP